MGTFIVLHLDWKTCSSLPQSLFYFFFLCDFILDQNSPEFMIMSSVHTGVSRLASPVVFALGTFATMEVGGVI